VESALTSITTNLTPIDEGKRISIRLLLHPAEYVLNDSLVIRTLGSTQISVETLEEFPCQKKGNLHREDSVSTVLIDGTDIVQTSGVFPEAVSEEITEEKRLPYKSFRTISNLPSAY
jgi:hypothetical protein